jgi:fatty-acyl-CoA synthase
VTTTPRSYQLADLFEAVADAVPDRMALVAGDRRLTFRELDERATRFANHLRSLDLNVGAKVGIYAWNRAEWLEAMIGCFKARMVPVNVNYRYVAEELSYLLDNADVEALVFERGFAANVEALRPRLPGLRHLSVLEDGSDGDAPGAVPYEEALAAASPERSTAERSPDDLYILYTGGTTGMPKGVMWRHEDIFFAAMGGNGFLGQGPVRSPAEVIERIAPEGGSLVTLVCPPLMHGAAQWGVFIMLFGGGEVVLHCSRRFDGHELWRLVERERCTGITLVGDAMARPLAEALEEAPDRYDTSSLVSVGSGGAIFSAAVKDQLRKHLPNAFMVDSFGASETGAGATQFDGKGPTFPSSETTTVLDDDLQPVEPGAGVVGRLARRGHIPLGYYKDEAKTAATFVTDGDGVRWAVPGDHGTVDAEGMIHLLGRGSGCINSGGEKIYPEEVEAALKSHPDVFDAVVIGVPDERFTERVAAIVHPRSGRAPTLEELADHCRTVIAGYKVPRQLHLVEAIGRTPSGKADYAWAKEQVAAHG